MKNHRLSCVALATLLGSVASGDVMYRINDGAAQTLPSNRVIDIPNSLSSAGDVLVHVYDSDGANASINGQLVLRGRSPSSPNNYKLKLKVVDAADADAFVQRVDFLLTPGLRNFGGLTFQGTDASGNDDPNDNTLRDNAALALSIRGDITGDITVGTVYHVEANKRVDNSALGGTIFGNITSTASFSPSGALSGAIAFVQAARGISGNLTANTDSAFFANIADVRVGPGLDAAGITGDIVANFGSIGRVYTTGPIGSASRSSSIIAQQNLEEVRTIDFSPNGGGPLGASNPRAFYVNASAGIGFASGEGIGRIESSGDIHGVISAGSMYGALPSPGVFSRGAIKASILVQFSARIGIVGKTIEGPIIVGEMFAGQIIAWDLDNPSAVGIPLIRMGRGAPTSATALRAMPTSRIGAGSPPTCAT